MTGEEIINNLLYMKRYVKEDTIEDSTIDEAIKALEQQPCEDDVSKFISRQVSLLEERMSSATNEGRWVEEEKCQYAIENLELLDEYIKAHPPVTPKEKTGKWISFGIQGEIDGQIVRAFTCSKCGAISIFRVSNGNIVNGDLCPNCGARMKEVEE